MKKELFMKKLIYHLSLSFTSLEISEIIDDYNEFFAAGIAEGRSEEELCYMLGNPHNIVRDIKKESNVNKIEKFTIRFLIRALLAITLLVYFFIYIKQTNTNANMARDGIIGIILIGLILWFLLKGNLFDRPLAIYYTKVISYKKIFNYHLVIVFLAGLSYLVARIFSNKAINFNFYIISLPINEVGPFVSTVYYAMITLGLIIFIYLLYQFIYISVIFYPVICNCISFIVFILCLLNMQHQSNNIQNISFLITKSLIVYLVGIIITVIATIYIHQFYRRRDS